MSSYTLLIKNNENFQEEMQEAVEMLQEGDSISIFLDSNTCKQSIVSVMEDENLTFKHITSGKKEYIIAKK